MTETTGTLPTTQSVVNVVVPVTDVQRARRWYREILELPAGDVQLGHLCHIPLPGGTGILLDQKLVPGAEHLGPDLRKGGYPLFMLSTDDIDASLESLRGRGVEIIEYDGHAVQNGHWFNFRDCEGNLLMMCGPN